MYLIDMSSAVIFWKVKPNLFNATETNHHFKNLLNRFSIPKAMVMYTLIVSLQFLIIVFVAVLLTSKIILGDWDLLLALKFTLVFMTFTHFLGMLTNLASLMKKEKIVTTKE